MSLQKTLLALLILTIASSVSSTACGSNPLLDTFGITAAFTDAQIVPGINYCKSLKNKETCCSATTINGFQDKADDLLARLSSAVAKRDKSLINIRKDVLPSLTGKLKSLKEASTKAAAKIQDSISKGGSGDPTTDTMNLIVMALGLAYSEMATTLTDNLSAMRSGFTDYQSARAACVVDLVNIQAAAWCLACDPEFTTKGVSAGGIEFSSNLVETLTDSCTPYFIASVTQSMIFTLNLMSSFLSDITSAMNKITKGDANGAMDFFTAMTEMATSQGSLDSASIPIDLPSGCSTQECDWIADTLFEGGELNEATLALGGAIASTSPMGSLRMLEKEGGSRRLEESRSSRMLSGSWDPEPDEAGVKVTFKSNPGNVDNSSATLYKSIIGGLVVLFSVLLI